MTSRTSRRTLAAASAFAATLALCGSAVAAQGSAPSGGSSSAAGSSAGPGVPAAGEHRATRASVVGGGDFVLPFHQDDQTRSFTFAAYADPYSRPMPGLPSGLPTDATGTVSVSHHYPSENFTFRMKAKVDCLVTGPGTASLTAVVTEVNRDGFVEVGERVGFSVLDGGKDKAGRHGGSKDRVGFSWAVANVASTDPEDPPRMAEVGTCMSTAPYAPVTSGGYTVEHAELPPVPAGAGLGGDGEARKGLGPVAGQHLGEHAGR